MKYSKGLVRAAKAAVEDRPIKQGIRFRHNHRDYQIVACPADHSNPHEDHCMICAPFWMYFPREVSVSAFGRALYEAGAAAAGLRGPLGGWR